jgi:hypothetical protein
MACAVVVASSRAAAKAAGPAVTRAPRRAERIEALLRRLRGLTGTVAEPAAEIARPAGWAADVWVVANVSIRVAAANGGTVHRRRLVPKQYREGW